MRSVDLLLDQRDILACAALLRINPFSVVEIRVHQLSATLYTHAAEQDSREVFVFKVIRSAYRRRNDHW